MNRRDFLKYTGMAAVGLNSFPFILPSGRLFAPTGERIANHVVFCLFAGGIRNLESIEKADGNLMPNILKGSESISKDILPGIQELPKSDFTEPLQTKGTLYKGFRHKNNKSLHYTAHAAAIMGVYSPNVQLMKPLNFPSIFEYYRKHTSPSKSALNAWWISDQAGPFSFLNYSNYEGYGSLYGANMLQPTSFFNSSFLNLYNFEDKDYETISKLQVFFNAHAQIPVAQLAKKEIENSLQDRRQLEQFLHDLTNEFLTGSFDPWGLRQKANEDVLTMYAATKILQEYKPELLVVNMQHSDIGHSNFTQYCNNIHKADFAVSKLWQTIQSTPGLKDDTILILAPEFGRNLKPNTLIDTYGRHAIDHTGDEHSQKIFCLIAGPPNLVKQNLEITEDVGETIDIVPTIAKILGFDQKLPKEILYGKFLQHAFV